MNGSTNNIHTLGAEVERLRAENAELKDALGTLLSKNVEILNDGIESEVKQENMESLLWECFGEIMGLKLMTGSTEQNSKLAERIRAVTSGEVKHRLFNESRMKHKNNQLEIENVELKVQRVKSLDASNRKIWRLEAKNAELKELLKESAERLTQWLSFWNSLMRFIEKSPSHTGDLLSFINGALGMTNDDTRGSA